MSAYMERLSQAVNDDDDFIVYVWNRWTIFADRARDTYNLYDPYGTFVSQCDTIEEAVRKAAQIDEAW